MTRIRGVVRRSGFVYDGSSIPESYDRARDHGPEFLKAWMEKVREVAPVHCGTILDLGCGTARFSLTLASAFDATVIGVDPSIEMLAQARRKSAAGRSSPWFVRGSAESLAIADNSIDLVFMSMVFHHLTDPGAAADECKRVLRPGGMVFVRGATKDEVPEYAPTPFFPASVDLMLALLPSRSEMRAVFTAAGFAERDDGVLIQQTSPTLEAYADKLEAGGDSVLARMERRDFVEGLARLRHAAATYDPRPVREPVAYFAFESPSIED